MYKKSLLQVFNFERGRNEDMLFHGANTIGTVKGPNDETILAIDVRIRFII